MFVNPNPNPPRHHVVTVAPPIANHHLATDHKPEGANVMKPTCKLGTYIHTHTHTKKVGNNI
jgi:hypothetical protein